MTQYSSQTSTSSQHANAASHFPEARDTAKSGISHIADSAKSRVCTELRTLSKATHAACQELQDDPDGRVNTYASAIERQCDRAASYLDNSETKKVADDAADVARKHPALVLGSAAVAGFALGRFVSASRPTPKQHSSSPSTGSSGATS